MGLKIFTITNSEFRVVLHAMFATIFLIICTSPYIYRQECVHHHPSVVFFVTL
jgi:hypothetical protein